MKHQVTISNHALEEMVLAAGESFVLGSTLTDERAGRVGRMLAARGPGLIEGLESRVLVIADAHHPGLRAPLPSKPAAHSAP